jgi:hypothetical protein
MNAGNIYNKYTDCVPIEFKVENEQKKFSKENQEQEIQTVV